MKSAGIFTISLFLMSTTVRGQERKDESMAETLRQMLEQQNRVITLIQEVMETRLRRVEALVQQATPTAVKLEAPNQDIDTRIKNLEAELQQLREEQQNEIERLETEQAAAQARVAEEAQKTRDVIAPIAFTPRLTFFGNVMGRADNRKVYSPGGDRIDNTFT